MIHIQIPEIYVGLAQGFNDPKSAYSKYVRNYISYTEPYLVLKKIDGRVAICERKERDE